MCRGRAKSAAQMPRFGCLGGLSDRLRIDRSPGANIDAAWVWELSRRPVVGVAETLQYDQLVPSDTLDRRAWTHSFLPLVPVGRSSRVMLAEQFQCPPSRRTFMKRLAFAAVVTLTIMACSKQDDAAVVDTTMAAPAMAPAPAAGADSMVMDSTVVDSAVTADTAMVPPPAE